MIGVNHKEAKKRLQEIVVDSKSKSLRAFALSINVDPSLIAKVINGQRTLTASMVDAISDRYRVSKDWLLFGRGEKYGQDETTSGQNVNDTPLKGASITLQDYINELKDSRDRWHSLVNSILTHIEEDTRTALAYQKAWVEYEAEKASGGVEDAKADLIHRMNTLVRGYLLGRSSVRSVSDTGKKSKD